MQFPVAVDLAGDVEEAVNPRPARSTDATRLTFPLQLVVIIVSAALSAGSAMWAVSYGMRSDVRDILTRLDAQREIDSEKSKLLDERFNNLRDTVQDMKRRVELQQYEVQRLNETIARIDRARSNK